jgi:hypothetical protein
MRNDSTTNQVKITKIETTTDNISGRGGLTLFLRYVESTGFYTLVTSVLGTVKTSGKGISLLQFFKQMLAFFIDGTDMSIAGFDRRKTDSGYAAVLENQPKEMASSHQIKRFFRKLVDNRITNAIYRKILHELFIWRLMKEQPSIIVLGIDTMVMDNDDAQKREGVEPTYKKKKGYQPLHISWGPFLIDVLFRSGSKHSNHGNDFTNTVRDIVQLIRTRYDAKVVIILVADSGFSDQKAFEYFEKTLKIFYIISSRMYKDIKEYLNEISFEAYRKFEENGIWSYIELGNMLKSWKQFRRCIFTTLETEENGQFCLEFVKTDMLLYTNIGQDAAMTKQLIDAGGSKLLSAEAIIGLAHQRGKDELIHRSIKELATKEQLPFKKMEMNRGYYYLLVFAHFLFESYKRDVTADILPIGSYPNTFRRQVIDFAVKVTSHSRQRVLKVTETIYDRLNILQIWERCQSPPLIVMQALA